MLKECANCGKRGQFSLCLECLLEMSDNTTRNMLLGGKFYPQKEVQDVKMDE